MTVKRLRMILRKDKNNQKEGTFLRKVLFFVLIFQKYKKFIHIEEETLVQAVKEKVMGNFEEMNQLKEEERPTAVYCEKKQLKDRAVMHMCLWDWICSPESKEAGYTLATLKVGCSIVDALELINELPGNYVYIHGVSQEEGKEAYGFICTDKPKVLPDWDSCFFVGIYKSPEEEYKAVTSLYQLSDFLPGGSYRLGAIVMAGVGNTETVSLESFLSAMERYKAENDQKNSGEA